MWRTDRAKYESIVKQQVQASKKNIPEGLDISSDAHYQVKPPPAPSPLDDDDFWDDEDELESEEEEEDDDE